MVKNKPSLSDRLAEIREKVRELRGEIPGTPEGHAVRGLVDQALDRVEAAQAVAAELKQ